jgi:glycerol kinase
MIGDSHAAAFGEGCFTAGTAKATLGTGCSILLNTGPTRVVSKQGMVTTICWSTGNRIDYALEGVIVTCGATIQWLRDHLGLFAESRQTEAMALAAKDNHGVCLIPAFSGMGTPYWRMDLKAAILGLTFGCDKTHIVRAALESMAFQVKDVLAAMEADSGIAPAALNVDGGITANRFVMQFLADLLNLKVMTLGMEEVSALGAACLAGLEAGLFKHLTDLEKLLQTRHSFPPGADRVKAGGAYEQYCTYLQMLLKGGL